MPPSRDPIHCGLKPLAEAMSESRLASIPLIQGMHIAWSSIGVGSRRGRAALCGRGAALIPSPIAAAVINQARMLPPAPSVNQSPAA